MQEEEMIYEEEEIAVPDIETIDVEMSEAFPSTGESDALNHATLNNREIPDAHPITSITGLRKELDTIKALQTVYSDKKGNADYYAWAGGLAHDAGYFVSLNEDTISICTGDDIFGVVVDDAAFIGGQDGITLDYVNGVVDYHGAARDMNYGLVATSGAVLVRCESDVIVGDYVVSNAKGEATRAISGCGYQVVEIDKSHDTPYAMVVLTTSANKVDKMGAQIQDLDGRVNANYNNIISATNLAQDAYDKAVEASGSASLSEEEVRKALESILKAEGNIEDFQEVIDSSNAAANEAKQLAYVAVQDATNLRNEAVKRADEDWKDINDVIDTLEPITSWEDPETGTKGADYLATQMNKGIATSYDVKTVDSKTDRAMSAVIRNGKELQSLMTVIDKYSVGPHSQAYGFTLEQAMSVLEDGMLYVPTEEITEEYLLTQEALEWIDDGKDNDKVYYTLSEGENGEIVKTYWYHDYSTNDWVSQLKYPRYQRKFTPEFLYQWGRLNGDGPYRWNTIDIDYDPAEETNVSDKAVWFRHDAIPSVAEADNFGYWYTDGDTSNGAAKDYEKHTLYKWEKPEGEDGYWFAVATLAGNTQARVSSQIRQDANKINMAVTDLNDNYAGMRVDLSQTAATVQTLATWQSGVAKDVANIATIQQKANATGSSVSQIAANVGGYETWDGTSTRDTSKVYYYPQTQKYLYYKSTGWHSTPDPVEAGVVINAASIVAAVNDSGSSVVIDADHINFTADDYSAIAKNIKLDADDIVLNGYVTIESLYGNEGKTTIDGSKITSGTITAEQIKTDTLIVGDNIAMGENATIKWTQVTEKDDVATTDKVKTVISESEISTDQIKVTDLSAFGADIGGWEINGDGISKGTTLINSNDETKYNSVATADTQSPVRFATGPDVESVIGYRYYDDWTSTPTGLGLGVSTISVNCDGGELVEVNITDAYAEDYEGSTRDADYIYGNINPEDNTFDIELFLDDGLRDEETLCVKYTYRYRKAEDTCFTPAFTVLDDGSIYASAARISGTIYADDGEFNGTVRAKSGSIGKLDIAQGGLTYGNAYTLNEYGLSLNHRRAQLTAGNVSIFYDDDASVSYIEANGALKMRGQNSTAIELMTDKGTNATTTYTATLYGANRVRDDGGVPLFLELWIETNAPLKYPVEIRVPYERWSRDMWGESKQNDGTLVFKLDYDQSKSPIAVINTSAYDIKFKKSNGDWSDFYSIYAFNQKVEIGDVDKFKQTVSNSNIKITGNLVPSQSAAEDQQGGYNLGSAQNGFWNVVYARTGEIDTSDANQKNSIKPLSDAYEQIFDALKPVSYKFNVSNNNRTHTGLIAQDVKKAVEDAGLTTQDFAAYCEWENDDGTTGCGLRYSEFIALCVNEIQKLKKRVEELEEKLNATK